MNEQTIQARSRELALLLERFEPVIKSVSDPERLAIQTLAEPGNRLGSIKRAYSDTAERIWEQQLRVDRNATGVHHMAIVHTARAIDLEADGRYDEADSRWRQAFRSWRELLAIDRFWDDLATMCCQGRSRDPVDRLRQNVPVKLLSMCCDIAAHEGTLHHRKEAHMLHVAQAPFADEDKDEALRLSYDKFIARVPDRVWQQNCLDAVLLTQANEVVRGVSRCLLTVHSSARRRSTTPAPTLAIKVHCLPGNGAGRP